MGFDQVMNDYLMILSEVDSMKEKASECDRKHGAQLFLIEEAKSRLAKEEIADSAARLSLLLQELSDIRKRGTPPFLDAYDYRKTLNHTARSTFDKITSAWETKWKSDVADHVESLAKHTLSLNESIAQLENAEREAAGSASALANIESDASGSTGGAPKNPISSIILPSTNPLSFLRTTVSMSAAAIRINALLLTAASFVTGALSEKTRMDKLDLAERNTERAYGLASGLNDDALVARCQFYRGLVAFRLGRVDEARNCFVDAQDGTETYAECRNAQGYISMCDDFGLDVGSSSSSSTGSTASTSLASPASAHKKPAETPPTNTTSPAPAYKKTGTPPASKKARSPAQTSTHKGKGKAKAGLLKP